MAAVDKIYGNGSKWDELYKWLDEMCPVAKRFMYPRPENYGPISNFPRYIDRLLLNSCKIDWVVERIKEQHNLENNPKKIEEFMDL